MNKEQVTGKFDQAAGKIKQKLGEAVGNQKIANQGVADQIKGAAKETWGRVKDTASEVQKTADAKTEAAREAAEHRNDDTRDRIASAAQNVKDKIGNKLDDIRHTQRREREESH